MPRPARTIPSALRVAVLLGAGAVSGCAAPESGAYQRHLHGVVTPGTASNDEIAVAFGLDGYEPTLIAAVMPEGAILAE